MALDLAHRHTPGVEAQNLVVEPIEPRLAFRDKAGLETPAAIAGDRNLDLAVIGQQRLRTRAVAAVAASPAGWVALLVAQMLRQLGAERPPAQPPLYFLENPLFPRQTP